MPVNMDPNKRKQKNAASQDSSKDQAADGSKQITDNRFGEETEADREKAIADAEWKNLWDATEVIDMDTW